MRHCRSRLKITVYPGIGGTALLSPSIWKDVLTHVAPAQPAPEASNPGAGVKNWTKLLKISGFRRSDGLCVRDLCNELPTQDTGATESGAIPPRAISVPSSSRPRRPPALIEGSTSGVSVKAGALRALRSLDPASFDVLLGIQAEGERDGRLFPPPAQGWDLRRCLWRLNLLNSPSPKKRGSSTYHFT